MKIAFLADLHLNKSTYKRIMDRIHVHLPFRTVDFMRAFRFGVDECINNVHPDLVVLLGDIYDHFDPSNEIRAFFHLQIKRLTDAKIPVLIIIGNHDLCSRHHALQPLLAMKLNNVKIIEHPCIVPFRDIDILAFPYSIEVGQRKQTIRDSFKAFKPTIDGRDKTRPSIFIGHCGVVGAKVNEYDQEVIAMEDLLTNTTTTECVVTKALINRNRNDIGVNDLDKTDVDYVFMGHYHKFQLLSTKKCTSMYVGSMEKTDMSERDQAKGFVVYDTEANEIEHLGKCRIIQYPDCRSMIELKGNLAAMRKQLDNFPADENQDAVIKLSFVGDKNELVDFSTGIHALKKHLGETYKPIHVYYKQTVSNTEEEEKASKVEKEILARGHIDAEAILDVISEMLGERLKDNPDELKAMIELAQLIHKQAIEGEEV